MTAHFTELWRRHTIAYAPIRLLAGENVYPQHISGVIGARFPAISLHIFTETMKLGTVTGLYRMDTWAYNEEAARLLQDYLEDLYCPENIDTLPTDVGVQVLFVNQLERRDGVYETDTKLFHKIGDYKFVWRRL